jgi:hypothetical protein
VSIAWKALSDEDRAARVSAVAAEKAEYELALAAYFVANPENKVIVDQYISAKKGHRAAKRAAKKVAATAAAAPTASATASAASATLDTNAALATVVAAAKDVVGGDMQPPPDQSSISPVEPPTAGSGQKRPAVEQVEVDGGGAAALDASRKMARISAIAGDGMEEGSSAALGSELTATAQADLLAFEAIKTANAAKASLVD